MHELSYLDFDVMVERGSREQSYRARVVTAPSGQTRPVDFTVPFSDLEIENFLLKIGHPRRQPVRGLGSVEDVAAKQFGAALFDAVFHDDVRVALATSLDQAETQGVGLRLRLRLADVPELADLPWEYLYDSGNRRFVALSEWTPLVRYLDLPRRIRPLVVTPPLNVLVVVAGPTDFPPLDVNGEWNKLRQALADLEHSGRVRLERTTVGTLAALQQKLRRGQYHVFHYIGHGGYDTNADDGVLAFEDSRGRAQLVSGQDLGALLHDHRTLRLAVLNSCEGARGGRTDPYSGTAQSLIRQDVPAVVAMQFEITDDAAIVFSHALYEAVGDGYPLDAAIAEGRKAIRNQPNPVEWATPVLYLRAPDGHIFDLTTTPDISVRSTPDSPSDAQATQAPKPAEDVDSQLTVSEDTLPTLGAVGNRQPEMPQEPGQSSRVDTGSGTAEPLAPRARGSPGLPTGMAVLGILLVLIYGVLVPRDWHNEFWQFRVGAGSVLVVLAVAGLWSRQWKWVLTAGIGGLIGLALWLLQLLGTHTKEIGELFSPGADGVPNAAVLGGAILVLVAGVMGTRSQTSRRGEQ